MEARSSSRSETSYDDLQLGLKKVRNRRWFLWLVILIYLPGLFFAMDAGLTSSSLSSLFFAWVGLLCVAVGMATVVKCPGCDKPYQWAHLFAGTEVRALRAGSQRG